MGALSHHDALAAGHFRDTASEGLLKKKERNCGMVGVGCSRDEAQGLMKKTGLSATIACFDELGIFARRLKVGVAYPWPQMHDCCSEYYASIEDIKQRIPAKPEATMVSPSNLINPVLFSDALKELVIPAAGDNTTPAVDLLVEIGPHSALGGPVEQILSHHGIRDVDYTSMLVRGQSALDTSLALASELFRRGVQLDVADVNGDAGNCRLLTDLPP
ncbi:hypothetical protein F4780DRAFT_778622 [Xylariomycetidae sp. FL0641]|nr:hypothetical protein F4780DRAFT_778622 [Xylariomycetidae sp. FL0641]